MTFPVTTATIAISGFLAADPARPNQTRLV
jgi:hypothetical protein